MKGKFLRNLSSSTRYSHLLRPPQREKKILQMWMTSPRCECLWLIGLWPRCYHPCSARVSRLGSWPKFDHAPCTGKSFTPWILAQVLITPALARDSTTQQVWLLLQFYILALLSVLSHSGEYLCGNIRCGPWSLWGELHTSDALPEIARNWSAAWKSFIC